MTDRRPEGTAYTGAEGSPPPIPADMPDQQVQDGEDALDVILPPNPGRPEAEPDTGPDAGKPDPDEAGSGRSAARNAGVHPEHPTPDESTG
ncbi:MAG TPA: hypothetical protein VN520_05095 [Streptomyces sp.]|uniref:hypothetical protein n=1 Tax=Streptomyces sp. TaxID=1931 RepID=UPI002D0D9E36|nr:hypothetical protein [Streptomyces sp.]HWU05763.1 hypothetical protein [Streptomyces sp.]